jgi:hypothetical protein
MEQNKLEKQIKEKLNSREIQPSAQAWDRLDAMLSVAEDKKPKRSFRWLYIAASIIGFVFFGMLFYNQNQENSIINNSNQIIVDTNAEVSPSNETSVETEIKNELPTQQSIIKKRTEINYQQSKTIVKNESQIANNNPKKVIQKQQNQEHKIQEFVKINEPKQEVFAEVIQQKTIEKSIQDNNTILQTTLAENNKTEVKTQNKTKLKIDASTLLSQVDNEIEDLTFRQKAIKTISKNFKSAKEAVAIRNNQ